MAEAKTKPTNQSVEDFINKVAEPERRADCLAVAKIMEEITGEKPKMWGPSIVGFGSYHYKYASGREGDWPLTGFSPRKKDLTLYIIMGFEKHGDLGRSWVSTVWASRASTSNDFQTSTYRRSENSSRPR